MVLITFTRILEGLPNKWSRNEFHTSLGGNWINLYTDLIKRFAYERSAGNVIKSVFERFWAIWTVALCRQINFIPSFAKLPAEFAILCRVVKEAAGGPPTTCISFWSYNFISCGCYISARKQIFQSPGHDLFRLIVQL